MNAERPTRDPVWWHLLLVLGVSAAYESLFLHHGLNVFDEGWPAYAALQLRAGRTLYDDVFFPFPPGHLLPAWIAGALDPPGVVAARRIYALFNTLACLGLYGLGRRCATPTVALFGALLLAIAAPRSHLWHLLFGYRYMVFSMLALLCFSRRLRGGGLGWMLVAGGWAGIALDFRLTPAFAVSCAVGLAAAATHPAPARWLRDGGAYALGMLATVGPLLAYFAAGVGLVALWDQVVVHIVALQEFQSKPLPALVSGDGLADREGIYRFFVALEYRAYPLLYAGYTLALAAAWWRARRRGSALGPERGLLLAVVLWGSISLFRTLGRSDEPHLDSALPPACLLLAHAAAGAARHLPFARRGGAARPRLAAAGVVAGLALWSFLLGTDTVLAREGRGRHVLASIPGGVAVKRERTARNWDAAVAVLRRWTRPEEPILDLSASPLVYVLADRLGPGGLDIVMPGTFTDPREERAFVARLDASPPAAIVWPRRNFDRLFSRSLLRTAPRVRRWVMERYRTGLSGHRVVVLLPVDSPHLPADTARPDEEDGP